MRHNNKPRRWSNHDGVGHPAAGYSMIEAIISTALALVLVGLAFTFFTQARKGAKSEQSGLDLQQAARVAVDELARQLQQAGYGVNRAVEDNPSRWQKGLIYGGAHAIAFNLDLDPNLGSINTSTVLTFPTGETYNGEGVGGTTDGAETYFFSLDANGDGNITLADRTAAESGAFNPASATANPLDFAVFRRVYGYDGTSYTTGLAPITPYLFTNAVSGVLYADGKTPEPLFTYILTEDLNDDNILDDSECVNDVVDTCPPGAARDPLQYIWGDTDFSGALSDAERDALLTAPVGSPAWSKNPLASGGSMNSTTMQAVIDPATGARVLEVADATKTPAGSHIQFGTGFGAETGVVQSVSIETGNDFVALTAVPTLVHGSGSPIQVLPGSLLRAVRAIQVNFTAISPTKDSDNGHAPVGSTGRKTTHGMDYRTLTLQRTVHLVNQATVAQAGGGGVGAGAAPPPAHCPLTVITDCSGSSPSQVYTVGTPAVPVSFKVTTSANQNASGVRVTLVNKSTTVGSLSDSEALVDANGLVSTTYTPTGAVGTDIIAATAMCGEAKFTSTLTIDATAIEVSTASDCLETSSARNPNPGTSYTVRVRDDSGYVPNAAVDLRVAIDPDYLSPSNYSNVQAVLYADGSQVGATDSSGSSATYSTTTGLSQVVAGEVKVSSDYSDGGVRVNLFASVPSVACQIYGGDNGLPIDFYKLELDSVSPYIGCIEGVPCSIPAGVDAPEVKAVLSQAGQPIPGATVTFTSLDTHGSPDIPPAESKLYPTPVQTTDALGAALVTVGNNGSSSITPANPLQTLVDVSTGGPGTCNAGSVQATSPRAEFAFEGGVNSGACAVELEQAYLILEDLGRSEKQCLHVKNPLDPGGCNTKLTGIKLAMYNAAGTAVDPFYELKKIEGGTIDTSLSCDNGDKETLFEAKCWAADTEYPNGQRWDFVANDCELPPFEIGPQEYLILNLIEWTETPPAGRKYDITLYFDCTGECSDITELEQKFELVTP